MALTNADKKRLGTIWQHVKRRCTSPAYPQYAEYGGRGITVCPEWAGRSSQAFIEWAERSGYEPGLSIDRIDNNKGYFPENCRWATPFMQSNNRSWKSKHGRGVGLTSDGRFVARIGYNGKRRHLGSFRTAEEAAEAYRKAVLELFGSDPVKEF